MSNELEILKERLEILEKENIELKNQLQPFLTEVNKRKEFLERRGKLDEKINEMLYKFHNKNR